MSRRTSSLSVRRDQQQQPMKIVHIKTQYVETDAHSFKSVVQNLTGKDSTIPDSPPSSSPLIMSAKMRAQENKNNALSRGGGGSFKFLSRDLSFDRLFKELPPIDELQKLLACD